MATFVSRLLSWFSPKNKRPILVVGDGTMRVSLVQFQVQGALSEDAAMGSLRQGAQYLQQIIVKEGAEVNGTFTLSFRTEPDGLIRMVLKNESTLTGARADELVQQFIGLAMSSEWRFFPSSGPSLVRAVFGVGVDSLG